MIYPPNIKEIEKFAEEIGKDVKYLLGEKYEGDLDLYYVKSLPANIVFNVGGGLNLSSVKSLPENITFYIKGSVWLESVETIHSSVKFVNFGRLILPPAKKVKIIW